jgi:hypothetical protein
MFFGHTLFLPSPTLPHSPILPYSANPQHFYRMNRSQDQDGSKPLTEQDVRLLRRYGKLPAREDLLDHQLERRKYFDSGDFSLSHSQKVSDIGPIQTGTEHPLRKGISHPLSPVPATSNIKDDSGEQEKGVKEGHKVKKASHLHQQMTTDKSKNAQ